MFIYLFQSLVLLTMLVIFQNNSYKTFEIAFDILYLVYLSSIPRLNNKLNLKLLKKSYKQNKTTNLTVSFFIQLTIVSVC